MSAPAIPALAAQLVERLNKCASEGCYGEFEGNCLDYAPNDPQHWCRGCVMQEAAKWIEAAVLPTAGSVPPPLTVEAIEELRANCHATYNGGWHHSEDGLRAFHHGMDTVCNVLAGAASAGVVRAAPLSEISDQTSEWNKKALAEAEAERAVKRPLLDRWFVEECPSPTAGKGFIAVDGPLPRVEAERLAAEKRVERPHATVTVWQHPKDFAQAAEESPV